MGLMDWLGSTLNPEIETQFNYICNHYRDGLQWWMYGGYRYPFYKNLGRCEPNKSISSLDYGDKKSM